MYLVLLIVNKNGSLIFSKVMSNQQQFTVNEMIRLGSTFHSMHAISSEITPVSMRDTSSQLGSPVLEGISEVVTETFVVKCLQTLTGVKFILSSNEAQSIATQNTLL